MTTNSPIGILDLNSLYALLDFAAGDFYWSPRDVATFAQRLARYRSFKNDGFFVAETGLGYDYLDLPQGQKPARLDMWRSFAYGAISYLIFRWRPPLGGQEQTALCLLSPAGQPRNTYRVARQLFHEVETVKRKLGQLTLPEARVAIVLDSDVEKMYLRHAYGPGIDYSHLVAEIFRQLHRRNIPVVFLSPESPFISYSLVILPSQRLAQQELSRNIETFVKNGGTVWAIGEINTADENGNFIPEEWPVYLQSVFKIKIHTGALIPASDAGLILRNRVTGQVHTVDRTREPCWVADIELVGNTETLWEFVNGYYQGQPAITYTRYGKGHVFYQGISKLATEMLMNLCEEIIEKAGIYYFRNCPDGVEIIDNDRNIFILNNNDYPVCFPYPVMGKAVMGRFNQAKGIIEVEPFGVCIVRKMTNKD